MTKLKVIYLFLFILLTACNGSNNKPNEPEDSIAVPDIPQNTDTIPNNQAVDHYQVLLMGNSHVRGLDSIIQKLIETRFPEKQYTASYAQGLHYLSDRINDQESIDSLVNTAWTHVILQAQKYSASGAFIYPTDAAVSLISLTKNQNSTPILFPEHPRLDNKTEGLQVHQLHKGIADKNSACVAPVGLAWDVAIENHPDLNLHHADGNHANLTGKLLTSLVFYQVITGELADALPYIETIDVDESYQDLLGQIASYTLEQNPACDF